MLLPNPSHLSLPFEVDEEPDFVVLLPDGTLGKLPDIDPELRAEDFNYSLQLSLGANMPFNSSYLPSDKLQDFESIVSDADTIISQETLTTESHES